MSPLTSEIQSPRNYDNVKPMKDHLCWDLMTPVGEWEVLLQQGALGSREAVSSMTSSGFWSQGTKIPVEDSPDLVLLPSRLQFCFCCINPYRHFGRSFQTTVTVKRYFETIGRKMSFNLTNAMIVAEVVWRPLQLNCVEILLS